MILECVNTLCKPTDPEWYCEDCGTKTFISSDTKCTMRETATFCTRCGNPLIAFTTDDLKSNIARGEEALKGIEPGGVFDIGDLFGKEN